MKSIGPRLEHANLTVKNLEVALQFLQTAFPSWKVRHRGETDRKWLHFGMEEQYVALEEARQPGELQSGKYLTPDINHLGFVVEDLDGLVRRLLAAGYREGIKTEHPHRKRCYFFDEDGFEWEFLEYLSTNSDEFNDYSS